MGLGGSKIADFAVVQEVVRADRRNLR